MAAVKVSIAMQKQVLELHAQGLSARSIAKTLKMGRNTVKEIIERGDVLSPGAIEPEWSKKIDWEKVHIEVARVSDSRAGTGLEPAQRKRRQRERRRSSRCVG